MLSIYKDEAFSGSSLQSASIWVHLHISLWPNTCWERDVSHLRSLPTHGRRILGRKTSKVFETLQGNVLASCGS